MGKFKKSGFMLVVSLVLSIVIFTLNTNEVKAEGVFDLSPIEYEQHLNGLIKSNSFYDEFNTIIKKSFPQFEVKSADYETKVTGVSQFNILEITPRSLVNDSTGKVSDISKNITAIGQSVRTI
jgi:hypothetical protein